MKHGRKPFAAALEASQFALEKQKDGLAKLCKAQEIRLNETNLQLSRMGERFMERLGRVEKKLAEADEE